MLLKGLLRQDQLSFQTFVRLFIGGYLNAQATVIRALRELREENTVPQGVREKHVLSFRERASIFDAIEAEQEGDK
jgi:hypothetical protein